MPIVQRNIKEQKVIDKLLKNISKEEARLEAWIIKEDNYKGKNPLFIKQCNSEIEGAKKTIFDLKEELKKYDYVQYETEEDVYIHPNDLN